MGPTLLIDVSKVRFLLPLLCVKNDRNQFKKTCRISQILNYKMNDVKFHYVTVHLYDF